MTKPPKYLTEVHDNPIGGDDWSDLADYEERKASERRAREAGNDPDPSALIRSMAIWASVLFWAAGVAIFMFG